jgi:cation transport ATPase
MKELLTRKTGIWLMIIGVLVAIPINILLIEFVNESIDVDILGAMLFVLGLVIAIACGKTMKHSSEWFTRRNGVRLCVITVIITAIFAYSPIPFLNGDIGGIFGAGVFVLGLILIATRWKY